MLRLRLSEYLNDDSFAQLLIAVTVLLRVQHAALSVYIFSLIFSSRAHSV